MEIPILLVHRDHDGMVVFRWDLVFLQLLDADPHQAKTAVMKSWINPLQVFCHPGKSLTTWIETEFFRDVSRNDHVCS